MSGDVVEDLDAAVGAAHVALLARGPTAKRMRDLFSGVFLRDLVPQLCVGIEQDKPVQSTEQTIGRKHGTLG